MIDAGLYLAYGLILIALVLSLVFPLIYMLQNLQDAKGTFIGIGVVVVVFIIAYLVSSGQFYFEGIEKYALDESQLKLIGAGLNTFYILAIIAIISAIYAEVSSMLK